MTITARGLAAIGGYGVAVSGGLRGLGAVCSPEILDHVCVECCDQPSAPRPPPDRNAIRTTCTQSFDNSWSKTDPRAQCMNATDRQAMIDICTRAYMNEISGPQVQSSINAIADAACARQHDDEREICERLFEAARAQHPGQQACLDSYRAAIVDLCLRMRAGTLSPAEGSERMQDIMSRCAPPPTAVPPEPMTPPQDMQPPPPLPPVENQIRDEITGGDPFEQPIDVPSEPVRDMTSEPLAPPPKRSAVRRWGPVVGVLIVVGGAVYLLR